MILEDPGTYLSSVSHDLALLTEPIRLTHPFPVAPGHRFGSWHKPLPIISTEADSNPPAEPSQPDHSRSHPEPSTPPTNPNLIIENLISTKESFVPKLSPYRQGTQAISTIKKTKVGINGKRKILK
ncbi:hypothetical protein AVEN_235825-1 [Araneus ventricosus]|uniref:Uncharacterized protein n=1 Tax=Araneus ventricosus TaxID=182803 RepID=A0A4Y2VW17_ARAVE|nr:hypothetical protein AVEN_235825-1 [Araneus ventricosus]